MRKLLMPLMTAGLLAVLAAPANADLTPRTFEFSQGNLAACAEFDINSDGHLVVTLWNTASVDVQAPEDVLTGVYFGIDRFDGELTPQSAILEDLSGTPVLWPDLDYCPYPSGYEPGGGVGGEWGYRSGISGTPSGADHLIASVGLDGESGDGVGVDDRFGTVDLAWPESPDGINYGIVNATYTGGGNAAVNGNNPLVTTGVIFTLGGLPEGFNLNDINGVVFNYGSDFSPTPAPGAAVLGLIGLGVVGWIRRRFA